MSTPITPETEQPPSTVASPTTARRSLRPLGLEVNRRVTQLQQSYLAGKTSTPRASLAHLRNAVAAAPGSVPSIWELTVAGLPGEPSDTTADVTREERAAHTALTLYASHQQSQVRPMHVPGTGLGHAVDRLAPNGDSRRDAVRRRFDAVATASSFDEVAHHLRGLVGQLRAANVPLDYGQLADDLVGLQNPRAVDAVRLRWARQYYRTPSTSTPSNAAVSPTSETVKDA